MTDQPEFGVPALSPVTLKIIREAMSRGWRDVKRAPSFAFVFAGVYVAFGWIMVWVTQATGQTYWLVFAAFGFPLIAPFAAVAFYEVSRRLERGQDLKWSEIMKVVVNQSKRQLPSMCAIIIFIFLFWFFIGHMIFALFLGLSAMTNISSSWQVFLTMDGLTMLAFGSAIGAAIATLLYMITVISLPLLLDREVDYVTAMITSFSHVKKTIPRQCSAGRYSSQCSPSFRCFQDFWDSLFHYHCWVMPRGICTIFWPTDRITSRIDHNVTVSTVMAF